MSIRHDEPTSIQKLAVLLRQANEAAQNASRALAEMRRAYLPAGSFRETDPETLKQEQSKFAMSSRSNATFRQSFGENFSGD